jgi:predicted esterase YcpF (UPF0227 family)
MPILLYIHGFLSSPLSYKAQSMQQWLQQHRPDIEYVCPFLTPYPDECALTLISIVEQKIAERAINDGNDIYLMGSSMGGFWATYLAERYNLPAVVINPAVDVMNLLPAYIDQSLKNYHTEDIYCLKADDLQALSRYDTADIHQYDNYWLFAQEGDKTLDYRLAVSKYQGCRQTIEPNGDHSFQGFDRFHGDAIKFFESDIKGHGQSHIKGHKT